MKTNVKILSLYIAYLLVTVICGKLSAHFQSAAQKTYLGSYVILSSAVLAVAVVLLVLVVIFRTLLNTRAADRGNVVISVSFVVISATLLVCSWVYVWPMYSALSLSPDFLSPALIMLLTSDVFNLTVHLRNGKNV